MMMTKNKGFYCISAKKWHYFSGITLSVFIAFHLFNQLFSLAGPAAHIALMEAFRKVYRHPVIETILMIAVISQLVTGIRLLFNRKKRTTAEKVQIYSGLYLSYFLLVHVGAVMYGRYVHLDTNFYYAGVGLNYYPATFYFIPYYFLAVSAISLHVAAIHYIKARSAWSTYAIGSTGIIVSVLILIGYTKGFNFREVPAEYQHFIRQIFGGS